MDLPLLAQAPLLMFGNISLWSVVGAVVPALVLVLIFYISDANPEPRTVIIITFVLGILTSIPVLIVGYPIRSLLASLPMVQPAFHGAEFPIPTAAAEGFLAAALPEEFFKFLVVWLYCSRSKAFDEPMDGVIYGATASLGFAALENVLYAATNDMYIILGRALTAVPCHACLGAIMGYFIGQARFKSNSGFPGMLLGLFVSFILHGLYDFFLMVPLFATKAWVEENAGLTLAMYGGALAVLVVLIIWTIALVFRLRAQQVKPS